MLLFPLGFCCLLKPRTASTNRPNWRFLSNDQSAVGCSGLSMAEPGFLNREPHIPTSHRYPRCKSPSPCGPGRAAMLTNRIRNEVGHYPRATRPKGPKIDSGRDPCMFNKGARTNTSTDHLNRLKEVAVF